MPIAIELQIETLTTAFQGVPVPPTHNRKLRLLANIISITGVATSVFRPPTHPTMWHVMSGSTTRGLIGLYDPLEDVHPGYFAVSLISPVYYETNRAGWKDNVHLVFSIMSERVCWRPNPFGGIHVFVRRGQNVGFTLEELKRVAIFICRFEEAIDEFPPVRRMLNDKDYILSNRFNPALRNLTLAKVYSRILDVADVDELSALLNDREETESLTEAYRGYEDSKYFKVDFTSFARHSIIEFYQHEGTVSAKSVIDWAEFVAHFVDFAINASDDAVMTGGSTIEDLARLVRLP